MKTLYGFATAATSTHATARRMSCGISAAVVLVALSGCDTLSPARVCSSTETIDAVQNILFDSMSGSLRDIDKRFSEQAFRELTSIGSIIYQGKDSTNGKIYVAAW